MAVRKSAHPELHLSIAAGWALNPGACRYIGSPDRAFITELSHGIHVFARGGPDLPAARPGRALPAGGLAVLSGVARNPAAPAGPPALARRLFLLGRFTSHLGRFLTASRSIPAHGSAAGSMIDHGMGVVIGETADAWRRRLPLSPGDTRRHQHANGQAAPDGRQRRDPRRRRQDPGRHRDRRRRPGRRQRRRRCSGAARTRRWSASPPGRWNGTASKPRRHARIASSPTARRATARSTR